MLPSLVQSCCHKIIIPPMNILLLRPHYSTLFTLIDIIINLCLILALKGPRSLNSFNSALDSRELEVDAINTSPDTTTHDATTTEYVSQCLLPTRRGRFRLRAYRHYGKGRYLEPVVMVAVSAHCMPRTLVLVLSVPVAPSESETQHVVLRWKRLRV